LASELNDTRSISESSSQQILSSTAKAAGFADSLSFVFTDFTTVSSPESYPSRLAAYIRQTNHTSLETTKKFRAELQARSVLSAKLQEKLTKSQVECKDLSLTLKTKSVELAHLSEDKSRLTTELTSLQTEHAKLISRSNDLKARLDDLLSGEAALARTMKYLLSSLPPFAPNQFVRYTQLFVAGFARSIADHASQSCSSIFERLISQIDTLFQASVTFNPKVETVVLECRQLRTTVQSLTARYSSSLSLILFLLLVASLLKVHHLLLSFSKFKKSKIFFMRYSHYFQIRLIHVLIIFMDLFLEFGELWNHLKSQNHWVISKVKLISMNFISLNRTKTVVCYGFNFANLIGSYLN
jgi:hypothetical protein